MIHTGVLAFTAKNKFVIGEAVHICPLPLAVMRWCKPHSAFQPNGVFHEASVDFRIRGSRAARCRNHIAFSFTLGRSFRFHHGFGVGETISGRCWIEQASGRGV